MPVFWSKVFHRHLILWLNTSLFFFWLDSSWKIPAFNSGNLHHVLQCTINIDSNIFNKIHTSRTRILIEILKEFQIRLMFLSLKFLSNILIKFLKLSSVIWFCDWIVSRDSNSFLFFSDWILVEKKHNKKNSFLFWKF